jgi:hypothetical protein
MTRTHMLSIVLTTVSCLVNGALPAAAQPCPSSSPNFDRVTTVAGRQMVAEIRRKDLDADIAASGGIQNVMEVNASTLAATRSGLDEHRLVLRHAGPLGAESVRAAQDQVAQDQDVIRILEGMQDLFACRARKPSSAARTGQSDFRAINDAVGRGMADGARSANDRLTRARETLVTEARQTWSLPREYGAATSSGTAVNLNDPFASGPSRVACEHAVVFRDTELVRSWDIAMAKYRISKEHAEFLASRKATLLSESWWARSSGPIVALALKQMANTIEGILTVASPRGSILLLSRLSGERAAPGLRRLYKKANEALEGGETLKAIVEGEFAEIAIDVAVDKLGALGGAIDLVRNTAENIEIAQDYLEFQAVVRDQAVNLDREFNSAMAAIQRQLARLEAIESVKAAIDQSCARPAVSVASPR